MSSAFALVPVRSYIQFIFEALASLVVANRAAIQLISDFEQHREHGHVPARWHIDLAPVSDNIPAKPGTGNLRRKLCFTKSRPRVTHGTMQSTRHQRTQRG